MLLILLTRIGHKFIWLEACEKTFQELKTRFTTALVLTILQGSTDFVIYCDESKHGLRAVLVQNGKVAYTS